MESTVSSFRFVRCPKCLTILTEFAEVPVYKCGGCGAILRAKMRSSSGQNSSTVSANPASQNLPDSDPLSNGSESLRQNIPASNVARVVEQAEINNLNVSDFSGDNEQNEINNLNVSGLNDEIHEAKRESSGLEGTSIGERLEKGSEELEVSPNVSPEAYGSLKSRDKFEESSETMGHCATSEEDMINMKFGNGTHFRTTSRSSSHAYEASSSSTDEDRKAHFLRFSRRTFRNKNVSNAGENFPKRISNERIPSADNGKVSSIHDVQTIEQDSLFSSQVIRQNMIESENHGSSSSPTRDVKVKINHRFSEQDNQLKILSKVDELRNKLTGLFNETADEKESSDFGVKTSQFQGKVPSKEYRSSLIPFSRQPSTSYFQSYPGNKCCHNEHCRPCPHNVCCHISEPASLPLHIQSSTINQVPQNLQFKASRPQTIVRHCRPVSGGAPFVICYKCFKLLQLPADFLVSLKRVNKLRCGACSQVLMYCFRPRSRSIPQTPAEAQHPPSEENDEFNVVAADENLTSRYKGISGWDPISSSESNSSEIEPALHKSRSFDERVEEEQGEGGYLTGPMLHNLMGYSSANELSFHNGYSHDVYQNTELDKQNFYRPSGRKRWERH